MAGADRIDDPAVSPSAMDLRGFPIFAALRQLTLTAPENAPPPGHFHPYSKECVRMAGSPRLSHPANEIESCESDADGTVTLRTHGFGLVGGAGELPLVYSAHLLEREYRGDHAGAAFLDLFHHRLLSFLYRAWRKHRHALASEAGEGNPIDMMLRALLGLPPGIPEDYEAVLVSCAAWLTIRPRPAEALRNLLEDYFDVPVEIAQFRGGWRHFAEASHTRLDDEPASPQPHCQLGGGAALGDAAWDPQAVIRVRVGPMPMRRYQEFLPGEPAYQALHWLVEFFSRGGFDFEINPILERGDVPDIVLEASGPDPAQDQSTALRLGWTTWLHAKPLDRDPDDTVLRPHDAGAHSNAP